MSIPGGYEGHNLDLLANAAVSTPPIPPLRCPSSLDRNKTPDASLYCRQQQADENSDDCNDNK